MTVKQISVFLENKYGRLNDILAILRDESVKVVAATLADTIDYGILRILTTDQQKAYRILLEHAVSANMSEVLAVSFNSQLDTLSNTVEKFTQAGITIEYMYCFSLCGKSILVLRTNNMTAANDVVRKNNLTVLSETDLMNL
ncbi:MAG: acetolactate synthase [Bacteroidales bacterium]|nr:acetolactate synthase [Bacteroidales bacterium]